MSEITVLGIDLAKNSFHVHGEDERGQCVLRKKLRRREVLEFTVQLKPCVIAMEACGGSHYWAREFHAQGPRVRMLSIREVKAFCPRQKNDRNDAEAICQASKQPRIREVAVKQRWQQDVLCFHRIRERLVRQRTALANEIRGLLMEYGLILPQGISHLRRRLPGLLVEGERFVSVELARVFQEMWGELLELDRRIFEYEPRIKSQAQQSDVCRRLQTIPGIGPITACALEATIGSPHAFRRGRELSAWLGLVPRQHSTGGKPRLGKITKHGDTYLRTLLVHGARAVLRYVERKHDPSSRRWAELIHRRGFNKAAVALANKNARMVWALMARGTMYQLSKAA